MPQPQKKSNENQRIPILLLRFPQRIHRHCFTVHHAEPATQSFKWPTDSLEIRNTDAFATLRCRGISVRNPRTDIALWRCAPTDSQMSRTCQNDCRTQSPTLTPNFQIALKCCSCVTYKFERSVGTSFASKTAEDFSLPLWSHQHDPWRCPGSRSVSSG